MFKDMWVEGCGGKGRKKGERNLVNFISKVKDMINLISKFFFILKIKVLLQNFTNTVLM
jgi:hypothetical protein